MTSFLSAAALTPLILALVPCLFSSLASRDAVGPHTQLIQPRRRSNRSPAAKRDDANPWWKTSSVGFDNYS